MGHTPGPWTLFDRLVQGRGGAPVAAVHGPHAYANARLIAAAPELLAALKDAYAALDYAQAQVDSDADRMHLTRCRRKIKPVIDMAAEEDK